MELAPLIRDLATLLMVAALVTFICRRIRQPVVVGYLIAGVLVGPSTNWFFTVNDLANIRVWADLGVIFFMFTLGLEFSFQKLKGLGLTAVLTGVFEIACMFALGSWVGRLTGLPSGQALFLGAMVAISSTTVIVKAFNELGLRKRRFAHDVFGILIIEDLAAILILVFLSGFARHDAIGAEDLLIALGKLLLVVGGWILVGMFAVPRLMRSVGRHGNNELLTIVSLGLCLMLVTLSAYFHYSVALGAFIMGSILAETSEATRIEHLMEPLKDLFGAVFFISVGMLFDFQALATMLPTVLLIAVLIILGKVFAVTFGMLATGNSLSNAIQAGFSMGQIGEFSFIMAGVGLAFGEVKKELFPAVVAAAVVTTFTTPYLIRASHPFAEWLSTNLPQRVEQSLKRYRMWALNVLATVGRRQVLAEKLARWVANAIIVVIAFNLAAKLLVPVLERYLTNPTFAHPVAWFVAFMATAPFIWAMMTTLRDPELASLPGTGDVPYAIMQFFVGLATILIVGVLSLEFFTLWVSLSVTVVVSTVLFMTFRQRLENSYQWFEQRFRSGFSSRGDHGNARDLVDRLSPWEAHLTEVDVHPNAPVVGKTLRDLRLGERFGVNVVVIHRGVRSIMAPQAGEQLFPGDRLLCFGTDDEIEPFRAELQSPSPAAGQGDHGAYALKGFRVEEGSRLLGKVIRLSRIKDDFGCLIVGVEREGKRLKRPDPDLSLLLGDLIWVAGDEKKLVDLEGYLKSGNAAAVQEALVKAPKLV